MTWADRLLARWRPISVALAAIVVVDVAAHVLVMRRTGAVSGDRRLILLAAQQRTAGVRAETDALERTASKLACAESEVVHVFDDILSSKEERMTAIQREVRRLAQERNLDADRISYAASTVKDTGLVRFTISFPLKGDYATLQDFVRAVEASPNFLIVDNISLDEIQGEGLSLKVVLATYFQAPDAEDVERAFAVGGRT